MSNGLQRVYRSAGNIIAFAPSLDPLYIDDVLVSELCAQLVTQRAINESPSEYDWAELYLQALKRYTWGIFYRRQYSIGGGALEGVTPRDEVLRLFAHMRDMNTGFLTQAVSQAMSALQRSAPGLSVPTASHHDPAGEHPHVFHFSAVDAEAILHSVRLSFLSREAQTPASILQPFDVNQVLGNVQILAFSAELSDIGYDDYRDGLKEKVAEKARELTVRLQVNDEQ
ncbi:hypothetical protein EC919_106132 [Pseudomonas graminis]|uniref:hypothetical protein n=1 Tax=Pseudomonas graminis TaxID=158627 RepID=UPI00105CE919|nr:hypothetical protein [Pseudomonas graminis]TDV51255.1 hypothetical protein EC919_106132 [Pseudomonas graminis]